MESFTRSPLSREQYKRFMWEDMRYTKKASEAAKL